jgi:hypothetical protein
MVNGNGDMTIRTAKIVLAITQGVLLLLSIWIVSSTIEIGKNQAVLQTEMGYIGDKLDAHIEHTDNGGNP